MNIDVIKILNLPLDILLYIFSFDKRFIINKKKYKFVAKIDKIEEKYSILSSKLIILKSYKNDSGVYTFPNNIKYNILIYDNSKSIEEFSIELEKSIKLYKTMNW